MWSFWNLWLQWTFKAVQPVVQGSKNSGADQWKIYDHKRQQHTKGFIGLHLDIVAQEEKLSQSESLQYETKWPRGHLQKWRRARDLLGEEGAYMSGWCCSVASWGVCVWGAIAAYGLTPTRLCLISGRWMLGEILWGMQSSQALND